MNDLYESLTPQERQKKFSADLIKKNVSIIELQKRLQSAQKTGNASRIELLKLSIEIAKLDVLKLRAKIKKEQLNSRI